MTSIDEYRDLIKMIPVNEQASIIKKIVWNKESYDENIMKSIFGDNEIVELSRKDVCSEPNIKKKIIMVLMWGYPNGGRGNNINNVMKQLEQLCDLLRSVNGKNLTKEQAGKLLLELENIRGLGISTWSKLLYFFNVSIDTNRCQIFDQKIVDSLNKKQFQQLGNEEWKQDINHYYQYIELVKRIADKMKVLPEQIELFLFYFNLYYKF